MCFRWMASNEHFPALLRTDDGKLGDFMFEISKVILLSVENDPNSDDHSDNDKYGRGDNRDLFIDPVEEYFQNTVHVNLLIFVAHLLSK